LSWVFGRFIRHSGWYPDRVVRLYATAQTSYTTAPVHEQVIVPAGCTVKTLDGDLLHYTYRDLQHYLVKSAQYADLWAAERKKRGKTSSLTQGTLHALGCFLKMYLLKAGFLDGKQGLLLALLSAHSTFAKYADLWIRDQPKP
jgi:(heptosyl)LPS beta-1,4-glucosyltransferase